MSAVKIYGDDFVLHDQQTREQENQGLLSPVFYNGEMARLETLQDIRARLWGDQ
jgi:hypothetical protein